MRPATGWIAYLTSTPFFLQPVGHFAQGVLRLRHRHAVARHDDDLAGVLHDEGGVLGRARFTGRVSVALPPAAAVSPPKPPRSP